jgi:hypothetical protein
MSEREGQALQRKLQDAVNTMMEDIDKKRLRIMQKNIYLKMASCCDIDNPNNREECLQRTTIPIQKAQQLIQNEMNSFQNRLQRCSMACEDDVKDKFDITNEKDMDKIQKYHLNCASQCVDKQLSLLKGIQSKIEKDIDQLAR